MLGLHLDRNNAGTTHADRVHRLLGACHGEGMYSVDRSGAKPRNTPEVRAVEEIVEAAQYHKYGLRVNPRHLAKITGMAAQFAYALNVPSVTVEVEGDVVWVRVPREDRPAYVLYDDAWALGPDLPAGHVLLGVNEEGQQLTLDLDAAPHCAVIGMSGSGKSTLMQTMVHSAHQRDGVEVALFDPGLDLAPLSGFGNTWQGGAFSSDADIEACAVYLAETLHQHTGRLYVFVDEAPRLCRRSRLRAALVTLGNEGRRYGVHLVLGAQTPKELGADLMANVGVSIVGQMRDAQHAAQATGKPGTGAEMIAEPGRFVVTKGARMVRLQAAMLAPDTLARYARQWPPRYGVLPVTPKAAIPPTPQPHQAPRAVAVMQSTADFDTSAPYRGDALPASVRSKIVRYWMRQGKPPTRRQVGEWVGVVNIDNDKWHRWLSESLGVHA